MDTGLRDRIYLKIARVKNKEGVLVPVNARMRQIENLLIHTRLQESDLLILEKEVMAHGRN